MYEKNPFQQRMPLLTDIKIRACLWWARLQRYRLPLGAALLVPTLAAWVFFVQSSTDESVVPFVDTVALAAEVHAAQQAEQARASSSIYHVVREIREGRDKPAFVASVLGEAAPVTPRVDVVETFQHSDTALTQIVSNGTERSLEVFLSREHEDGALSLHHYGPVTGNVAAVRAAYDEAHDLASLYSAYTSLERPTIPVLPAEAELIRVDGANDRAVFRTILSEDIYFDATVDLATNLVEEEVIYVRSPDDEWFEMTRVAYLERTIIPAEQFEQIFSSTQYDYEVIATKVNQTS